MTTSVLASDRPKTSWVQKYPLPVFFVLAIGLTWPFLIADALGSWGLIPFRMPTTGAGLLLSLLMAYCPTIAALLVTGLTGGRAGIRKLLGRILIWRVGMRWYFVAIFGVGLIFFVAQQILILLGGAGRELPPGGVPAIAINVLVMFLVSGLVNGEEFGWRGFALPRLQAKYNALTSSLILGGVWIVFHLPLFFTRGGGVGGNMSSTPFLAFVLYILAGSILITWINNNVRGSMLFAYLLHAAMNTWSGVFASASPSSQIFWIQAALFCAAAVAVIVAYGPARLSRRPEEEQKFLIEH